MRKIIVCGALVFCVAILTACLNKNPTDSEVSNLNIAIPDTIKEKVGKITLVADSSVNDECDKTETGVIDGKGQAHLELKKSCFPYDFQLYVCNREKLASDAEGSCSKQNCWYAGNNGIGKDNLKSSLTVDITLSKSKCDNSTSDGPEETTATATVENVNTTITAHFEGDSNTTNTNGEKRMSDIGANLSNVGAGTAITNGAYECRAFSGDKMNFSALTNSVDMSRPFNSSQCSSICNNLRDSASGEGFYAVCSTEKFTSGRNISGWILKDARVYSCRKKVSDGCKTGWTL